MTVADRAAEVALRALDADQYRSDAESCVIIARALVNAGFHDGPKLTGAGWKLFHSETRGWFLEHFAYGEPGAPDHIYVQSDLIPLTDEELEFRAALAESERPDMQALADEAMRHVERVNAVVEAAKRWERHQHPRGGFCEECCLLGVAVRALREDEG